MYKYQKNLKYMSCYYSYEDDCTMCNKGFICIHCRMYICYRCYKLEKHYDMVVCDAPEYHKDYLKEVPRCPVCPLSVGTAAHMQYCNDHEAYLNN